MPLGQQKGSAFERKTAREISLWLSKGESSDWVWKNRVKKSKMSPEKRYQLGDLSAVHTGAVFFFELFSLELKIGYSQKTDRAFKGYLPWDILDNIDVRNSKNNYLPIFWEQCERDAVLSERIPMLIFQRDYRVPVVCMYFSDALKVWEEQLERIPDWCMCGFDGKTLVMYRMNIFFNVCSPRKVKEFLVNNRKRRLKR